LRVLRHRVPKLALLEHTIETFITTERRWKLLKYTMIEMFRTIEAQDDSDDYLNPKPKP